MGKDRAFEDRIILEGLSFYGYHGARSEERTLGQRFVVDVSISLDLGQAGRSDDLTRTINYAQVYQTVRRCVEGPPCHLIEALAERVAQAILTDCGGEVVRVRVAKPWAPLQGSETGRVAVEITRRR